MIFYESLLGTKDKLFPRQLLLTCQSLTVSKLFMFFLHR